MLVALLAAAALVQADSVTLGSGARSPAYASDGRLAVSLRGDIWVLHPAGGSASARRVTGGPAWDRDPAWSADGRWIVFASDRAGSVDLWRIEVSEAGPAEPVRLTAGPEPEDQPTVSPRGEIAYVVGSGAMTDLWLLQPGGAVRRLTGSEGAEREPAFSPDGARIAYVAEREAGRTLRVLTLSDGRDAEIAVDRPVHGPSWAPDGRRLAFGTGPRAPGIWVVDVGGSMQARISETSGVPAWSPDGRWIAVADAAPSDGGYNGDPDRLGDRSAGDVFREGGGGLRLVAAPRAPDAESVELRIAAQLSREAYNGDAFDRVWARTLHLYGGGGAEMADAWQRLRESYRPRAVRAATDEELEAAIHAMLRARPPARRTAAGGAAVSSAHPLATAAGVEILGAGGNVVDAAVAVSFALGVVEPDASGVGGYGEMLVHLDGMAEPAAIEFMTRLPEASSLAAGRPAPLPPDGPRLANVPGTVAGMALAWRKYGSGKVSWARLIAPAIRLAERGFPIDDAFATTLRRERDAFAKYEGSRRLFLRDGVPLAAGDTLRNPDLAWTLRQIADGGAEAFYRGEAARRLVADLRAGGNPITMEDMRRYLAAERRPVRSTYRGRAVYSGPPPVTGGATLVAKLNLLEHVEAGGTMTEDAATLHAMIEAWRLQPSTANRIADPDLWPVDVSAFESKDTARLRWRCFDPQRSAGPNAARACGATEGGGAAPEPGAARQSGTTAFAVADVHGNAVSVTQTLGTWGGTFHVTPGLGFLYNDKAGSYRDDPGAYNARIPFARNTTVIAPTIVFDGTGARKKPWLVVGAAGNAWITAAVFQIVVGVIDHGMGVQEAIELPRFLPGGRAIQIEDGFAPGVLRRLEEMGHAFDRISLKGELRMGYASAVLIEDGKAIAGADPRRSGAAGAVDVIR